MKGIGRGRGGRERDRSELSEPLVDAFVPIPNRGLLTVRRAEDQRLLSQHAIQLPGNQYMRCLVPPAR